MSFLQLETFLDISSIININFLTKWKLTLEKCFSEARGSFWSSWFISHSDSSLIIRKTTEDNTALRQSTVLCVLKNISWKHNSDLFFVSNKYSLQNEKYSINPESFLTLLTLRSLRHSHSSNGPDTVDILRPNHLNQTQLIRNLSPPYLRQYTNEKMPFF